MKTAVSLFAILATLGSQAAFADDSSTIARESLKGHTIWVNARGSQMSISVSSSGRVSGSYINRDGNYSCQNTPYPISGWVDGTAISFSVQWDNRFENCNSVSGWTGFFDAASGEIETKWNLSVSGSTDPSQILAGTDTFSLVRKAETAALSK